MATQPNYHCLADLAPSEAQIASFWARVRKGGGCWSWTGAKKSDGYGFFMLGKRSILAHRLAFVLNGGMTSIERPHVLHSCHTPGCVNPNHLRAGTPRENIADCMAAGRRGTLRGDAHPLRLRPELTRGERNGNHKLSVENVVEIRTRYRAGGESYKTLAARYGVAAVTVEFIVTRRRWKHVA